MTVSWNSKNKIQEDRAHGSRFCSLELLSNCRNLQGLTDERCDHHSGGVLRRDGDVGRKRHNQTVGSRWIRSGLHEIQIQFQSQYEREREREASGGLPGYSQLAAGGPVLLSWSQRRTLACPILKNPRPGEPRHVRHSPRCESSALPAHHTISQLGGIHATRRANISEVIKHDNDWQSSEMCTSLVSHEGRRTQVAGCRPARQDCTSRTLTREVRRREWSPSHAGPLSDPQKPTVPCLTHRLVLQRT